MSSIFLLMKGVGHAFRHSVLDFYGEQTRCTGQNLDGTGGGEGEYRCDDDDGFDGTWGDASGGERFRKNS
jgi:hypothetical protein